MPIFIKTVARITPGVKLSPDPGLCAAINDQVGLTSRLQIDIWPIIQLYVPWGSHKHGNERQSD